MRLTARRLVAVLLLAGLAAPAACGARSGLRNPAGDGGLGSDAAGTDAGADAAVPECVTAADCEIEAGLCARAECLEGTCVVEVRQNCDDGDPCTADECDPATLSCSHSPATVDADGDGHAAPRPGFLAGSAGSCGDDCDDADAAIHPGAGELCDGIDNDCNGNIDDGLGYTVAGTPPVRVSSPMFERATRAGFAYDGASYGLTLTGKQGKRAAYFKTIDAAGTEQIPELAVTNVNAESFAGNMIWNGEVYATAWEDARQDTNYEIYFNLLSPDGGKLMPDLRLSNAADFSLHPQVVWTRSEFLVIWDDRRFEAATPDVRLFGQRIDENGALLGANTQLTPEMTRAEYAAAAVGERRVGVAFTTLEPNGDIHARFRSVSFDLAELGPLVDLTAIDANNPNVAYAGGRFVVTWERKGADTLAGPSIYGAVVSEDGTLIEPERAITAPARFARGHAALSLGDRLVLVWGQDQGGGFDLYFKVLSPALEELAGAARLTNTAADSLFPALAVGPDGDIGVLFDEWGPGPEVWFTRLLCGAVLE